MASNLNRVSLFFYPLQQTRQLHSIGSRSIRPSDAKIMRVVQGSIDALIRQQQKKTNAALLESMKKAFQELESTSHEPHGTDFAKHMKRLQKGVSIVSGRPSSHPSSQVVKKDEVKALNPDIKLWKSLKTAFEQWESAPKNSPDPEFDASMKQLKKDAEAAFAQKMYKIQLTEIEAATAYNKKMAENPDFFTDQVRQKAKAGRYSPPRAIDQAFEIRRKALQEEGRKYFGIKEE